jgi:lipopolysaccharide biosynthesis regulator YciM
MREADIQAQFRDEYELAREAERLRAQQRVVDSTIREVLQYTCSECGRISPCR